MTGVSPEVHQVTAEAAALLHPEGQDIAAEDMAEAPAEAVQAADTAVADQAGAEDPAEEGNRKHITA